MTEAYEPAPKDRKQMTDAELITEFPKIGFTYEGVVHNGEATGLEVRVTRGKEQFLIPTAAINESVALQEALFSLTNIVVIQQNQHWFQQYRITHEQSSEITTAHL